MTLAGSQLILTSVNTSSIQESANRLRKRWNTTANFITAEVLQSKSITTDVGLVKLDQCNDEISSAQFRFGLLMDSNIGNAIYYVQNNAEDSTEWVGESSLWRCGPDIKGNGDYKSDLTQQVITDGMNAQSCSVDVVKPIANSTGKTLIFSLCLLGNRDEPYSQTISAYSRVNAVYPFPGDNSICIPGLTINGFNFIDLYEDPTASGTPGEANIICGFGSTITINGTTGNDILETGRGNISSTLNGNEGNDRLLGGSENDTLNGDDGDDVLIGKEGDDSMNGGDGDDQYLPGTGANSITDDDGLDTVFLNSNKADVSDLQDCSKSDCELTYKEDGVSGSIEAEGLDTIIFNDSIYTIPD